MPQFDPTFYISQIIWLVVCFLALWAFVHWKVIPALQKLMNWREDILKNMISEAQLLQQKAESILQENQEMLDQARQDAAVLIQQATLSSQKNLKQSQEEAQALYKAKIESFQQHIENEKCRLLSKIDQVTDPLLKIFLDHRKCSDHD